MNYVGTLMRCCRCLWLAYSWTRNSNGPKWANQFGLICRRNESDGLRGDRGERRLVQPDCRDLERRCLRAAAQRTQGRVLRPQGEYGLEGHSGVVGDGVGLGLVALPAPLELPFTRDAKVDGEIEKSKAVVTCPDPGAAARSEGVFGESRGRAGEPVVVELLLLLLVLLLLLHVVGRLVSGDRGDLCDTIDW